VLVLLGLIAAAGGREGMRGNAFAAAFLIFAAPLPAAVYQPAAILMQQLVSGVSQELLQLGGIAVYREGYLLHVRGLTMEVGEACSGLRQLTAILALAVAIGYFSGRGGWYTAVLGLLSIPVAVVANCLRVTMTGYTMLWFGKEFGEGLYHTLEGLVMVAVAAAMVAGVAWLLAQVGLGRSPRQRATENPATQGA
jgi:exosortase